METGDTPQLATSHKRPKGLSRWKGMETYGFERAGGSIEVLSERTFPLEGNGNVPPVPIAWLSVLCPKGLSRWKGMETKLVKLNRHDNPASERTFPLEGNGND